MTSWVSTLHVSGEAIAQTSVLHHFRIICVFIFVLFVLHHFCIIFVFVLLKWVYYATQVLFEILFCANKVHKNNVEFSLSDSPKVFTQESMVGRAPPSPTPNTLEKQHMQG